MSRSPWTSLKALSQLGFQPVLLNALYRLGLASGHYQRLERREQREESSSLRALFAFPTPEELLTVIGEAGKAALLAEADEIVAGRVRLFGAGPVELDLAVPGKLAHWTAYETGRAAFPLGHLTSPDIKYLWEPARFGWAFSLGRTFHLTRDEKYAGSFWRYYETFATANPPYLGPNWTSGQEVALRIMAFVWAAQVFSASSSSRSVLPLILGLPIIPSTFKLASVMVYLVSQNKLPPAEMFSFFKSTISIVTAAV